MCRSTGLGLEGPRFQKQILVFCLRTRSISSNYQAIAMFNIARQCCVTLPMLDDLVPNTFTMVLRCIIESSMKGGLLGFRFA